MQEKKNRGIEPRFDFLDEFSGTFPWQNSRIFNPKINVLFSWGAVEEPPKVFVLSLAVLPKYSCSNRSEPTI